MKTLTLRAGLRSMPLTDPLLKAFVDSGRLSIEACGATPYTDTFRRMARELAYDIAEMPVVTQLLLADTGAPVTAMPVVLAGGGLPHKSLLCLADSDIDGAGALRGKRIGIRGYAQTTGVWIRGVLQHEYGVETDALNWVTTESSHVETFRDPENVVRGTGSDLVAMLRNREVDAIVASPHVVKGATDLRSVIPDAQTAAQAWARREGVCGVNHVLSLRTSLVQEHPWVVEELARRFTAAKDWAERHSEDGKPFAAFGDEPNRQSIDLLLRYAFEQKMTSRLFQYDDLFIAWPKLAANEGTLGSAALSP